METTFDLGIWFAALPVLAVVTTLVWLLSRRLEDVSIVDPVWPALFLVAHVVYLTLEPGEVSARGLWVAGLVALWTLRLGGYLTWRKLEEPGEDRRYVAMREGRGPRFRTSSLWVVFWLQAAMAWFVSLPLLASARSHTPLGVLDAVALCLFAVGFAFEALSDLQLARFKRNPANRGKVLDSGLWRYSRHPNYFGNACMWWAFYLLAVSGGGWWSLPGPLFMTFLLLKVSGVVLLEKDIGERRPGYAEYVRRTSSFVPLPPRRS